MNDREFRRWQLVNHIIIAILAIATALAFVAVCSAQVIHVKASDFAVSEDFEPTPDPADLFLAAMLANSNRIKPGRLLSAELTAAAQGHADYLARTGLYDADDPHNKVGNGTPRDRAWAAGFRGDLRIYPPGPGGWLTVGEILCASTSPSMSEAFSGWLQSPGHAKSICYDGFDRCGFGHAHSPYGKHVFVALYGASTASPPAVQSQPQTVEHYAPPSVTTPRGASYKLVRSCNGQTCTMQYVPVQPAPSRYVPQERRGLFGWRRK